MELSRREWLGAMTAMPLVTAEAAKAQGASAHKKTPATGVALIGREEFPLDGIHLNGAYTQPLPVRSARAIQDYVTARTHMGFEKGVAISHLGRKLATERFAKLINCSSDELVFIPSTMRGENYIALGLGMDQPGKKLVTDILHFDGSLYLYRQLAKRGMKEVIVPAHDGRIDLNDMEKAIGHDTDLVAITYVSNVNGFQHDLKALCDLAHSRGARVYADVVQAAGVVPLDVKATGLDYCACSSFKWLMGEQGAGFLYVRADRLHELKRTLFGYMQSTDVTFHAFPFDPPGRDLITIGDPSNSMNGHFGVGTVSNGLYVGLAQSLGLIEEVGLDRIVAHRQPMLKRLREALPELGFEPMTPPESTTQIITFAYKDAYHKFSPALKKARINAQLYLNRLRVSLSFFNSMDDVEKLIDTLKKA